MKKTLALIPARMAASRFPDKPLKKILDIPMTGHIIKRTQMSNCFDEIYVATCDKEIFDYANTLDCKAVMTSDAHVNCIDRCGEALDLVEAELNKKFDNVAVIQGDEPFVVSEIFEKAVKHLNTNEEISIVNIMGKIESLEDLQSPDIVKVVTNKNNIALYMSREPIPTVKKGYNAPWMKQTGLIFFKSHKLREFISYERTELEKAECVDMLRMLENGEIIQMVETSMPCLSVDTPNDLKRVEDVMRDDLTYLKYKVYSYE